MTRSSWSRLAAASLLAACVLMAGFAVASLWFPGSDQIPDRPSFTEIGAFLTIFLTFPAVGLVVVWRRPENPVGWLFLVIGVSITMTVFGGEYAAAAAYLGWRLPMPEVVAWLGMWQWNVGAGVALPLALLLFPNGRLPGPRWHLPVAVAVAGSVIVTIAVAVRPGPLLGYEQLGDNPFAAPGQLGALANEVVVFEFVPTLLMFGLALAALAVRSRRTDAERQQLKWLLYPVGGLILAFLSLAVPGVTDIGWSLILAALAAIPVCAGIAILRYRLYDIDVVIRRTLVYAVLVAILGVVYVGLVLALQALLTDVTGGETLPVALSTLVIVALFGPVRAWVRQVVDRRFYRSRYDAQQTVEAFAGRVRDEVELEQVGATLVDVASASVRPAAAGVWIRSRVP